MVAQSTFLEKCINLFFYGVDKESGLIDYDTMEKVATVEKPKMIICGASAYSRDWDYNRIRSIADSIGAICIS